MTHAEMDELYELYALGLVEAELVAAIDQHLADRCEYCHAHVKDAFALTAALAGTAPLQQPPAALRERVLQSVAPKKREPMAVPIAPPRRSSLGIFGLSTALAALLVGCIWLGYQNGDIRAQLEKTNAQLQSSLRDRAALEAALKDLSRSETRTVQFGKADQPHGRIFVNRNRGVVFVASSLPRIPAGRTFQLWLVPKTGAPTSAGLFQADQQGLSVRVSDTAVQPTTAAVAVSVEPEGGSTAPSTTPIIVVPVAE